MDDGVIEKIFTLLKKVYPDPKIELYYTSQFTLLVAIILSAQSTDVSVNKVTTILFSIADTPQKMLELGVDGLRYHIRSIGLCNRKAKNIIAMSQKLISNFCGEVPRDATALESLPGVGRKTANVLMGVLWNAKVIAVDTHVMRVVQRLGLCCSKSPLVMERALMKKISEHWLPEAHKMLVLHGRYICKARKPLCDKCILRELCLWYKDNVLR